MPDEQIIRIKNLRLRTVVGINAWERKVRQDVVINITLRSGRARGDTLGDTVDYRAVTKRVIALVEGASYNLLETLAGEILNAVLADDGVRHAVVEVDKPHALRFADSVSVTVEGGG